MIKGEPARASGLLAERRHGAERLAGWQWRPPGARMRQGGHGQSKDEPGGSLSERSEPQAEGRESGQRSARRRARSVSGTRSGPAGSIGAWAGA